METHELLATASKRCLAEHPGARITWSNVGSSSVYVQYSAGGKTAQHVIYPIQDLEQYPANPS